MLTKHLLTLSLLLPLVAISATAHAGSTITDKSYRPNEARQSAQINTVGSQRDLYSAFAYDRPTLRPAPAVNVRGSAMELAIGAAHRVADEHPISATPLIQSTKTEGAFQKQSFTLQSSSSSPI